MKAVLTGIWLALALVSGFANAQTPNPVTADQAGLVVIQSAHPFGETERRLIQAIEAAGLKVAARVDHEANAKSVGLQLPPTALLLFGNPRAGTVLMEQQRAIGIDLPLKMLIWEDEGKIKLAYNDPAYLGRRHGIDGNTPVLAQVSQALRKFAAAATVK
jgi:uncharacterized protein (DUF302 family)